MRAVLDAVLLLEALACLAVGDSTPPRFRINLDLHPTVRWNHVVDVYKPYITAEYSKAVRLDLSPLAKNVFSRQSKRKDSKLFVT